MVEQDSNPGQHNIAGNFLLTRRFPKTSSRQANILFLPHYRHFKNDARPEKNRNHGKP